MERIKYHSKFFALAVGVILVWRGVWGFADEYLLPNHHDLSLVASIILGIIILYFTDRKLNELL